MTRPPLDLEAIRQRAEAATPGPWVATWEQADDWWSITGSPIDDLVCPEVATVEAGGDSEAAFIAHAREDVPALLAEVERLAAENANLRATRDKHVARRREAEDRADHLLYESAVLSAQLEAAEDKVWLLEEAAKDQRS